MKQLSTFISAAVILALLCACGAKASARLEGTWILDQAATVDYLSTLELDQAEQMGLAMALPMLAGLQLSFDNQGKTLTMSLFGHDSVTSYGVRDDSRDQVVITDPAGTGADMEVTFLDEARIVLSSADLGILVLSRPGN